MKKLHVIAFAALFGITGMQAQEQESVNDTRSGSFGVEVNFNPFSVFLGISTTDGVQLSPTFSIEGLKVRYFFNEDMAIRGTIDISSTSNKNVAYDSNNSLYSTGKTTTNTFGFTPGFEYHFTHFKRGSVYAGAEIGFSVGNTKSSTTYENSTNGTNIESKSSIFGFGAGLFTGVDFYLTQKLYLGAELGLGYQTTKTTPNKSITVGSTTTEDNDYTVVSSFGFSCNPSIRLGWMF